MATYCSVTSFYFQIWFFSTFIFSSTILAFTTKTNSHPFNKIYAFGDSFTDTGNTRSVTGPNGFGHVSNFPYGSTFFNHSTNRYSDGRLVIDFLAEALSLPYLPPYLHLKGKTATNGVNFAVAGSTAIKHAFFVKNNLTLDITPQSIQSQITWFNAFLQKQGCKGSASSSPECKAALDDALIWIGEIGVNDYAYIIGSSISGDTIQKLAISSITSSLQELLSKGVKYVVVQGLPPSGCLPLSMTLAPQDDRDEIGCVKSVNNQTRTHNAIYLAKLQMLRKKFPNTTIAYLDYWGAYRAVMKNPGGYGFMEPLKACCGSGDPPYNFNVFATCGTPSARACRNPAQYINWDGVHLTEAMYKVLAGMFLNGSYSNPPFKYLVDKKQRQG